MNPIKKLYKRIRFFFYNRRYMKQIEAELPEYEALLEDN